MDNEAASVRSAPSDPGVFHPGTLQFITGAIHYSGTLPIKLPPVSGTGGSVSLILCAPALLIKVSFVR